MLSNSLHRTLPIGQETSKEFAAKCDKYFWVVAKDSCPSSSISVGSPMPFR